MLHDKIFFLLFLLYYTSASIALQIRFLELIGVPQLYHIFFKDKLVSKILIKFIFELNFK